ncbi:MAG: AbrB/MazE/SpoVT family DNA-binding domain-containing protein [Campylobacteraceae bacterium]|jgi:antitoxin MazE|nr:AbrB/MazE/SpoVT family DNA-binding domain-containing protein [Campylobacteraceae bacterium]
MTNIKLATWGNSTALRLPKTLLNQLGIDKNSTVSISITENQELLIKPVYKHKTLKERFEGLNSNYQSELVNWGEVTGEEIW